MCRTFVVLIASLFLASVATAATYFVDGKGNDAGPGSSTTPWRTLQHAADQIGPGDKVFVRPGEYVGFHLTTSGAPGNPIEFLAEPGAVITARNPVTPDGINLEGASHVVVDGFEAVGMPRAGFRTVGPYVDGEQSFAEFVTIRNVTSRDNGTWGILTGFVHDLLIENNRTSGSLDEHGIYVSNSGDRPVVRGNEIWGNRANGIHVNADVNSGLDGVIEGALITGNIIYDNGTGGGSGINLDGVKDSRIENNLIYNNHASGISLYQIDGAEPATGNVVVNNTVHQAGDGRWAMNVQDGAVNNTIANNIFISEHGYRGAIDASIDSLPGLVSDYNIVISRFTTDGGDSVVPIHEWQTLTGEDGNSFVADATELFVDVAAGDYRLKSDSPARDAGWNLWAAEQDLADTPRPVGPAVDIGAYEWRLAGDFSGDGVVNAADYVVWRNGLGTKYGQSDYEMWAENFGTNGGSGSADAIALPEPATLFVAALGPLLVSTRARRSATRVGRGII